MCEYSDMLDPSSGGSVTHELMSCLGELMPAVDGQRIRRHVKYKMLHKKWFEMVQCSRSRLHHHTPELFTRSYWQKSERVTIPWMLFKVLLAVYSAITWYLGFIHFGRTIVQDKYFIYLTNWSYCILTLQFLLAAYLVVERFIAERRRRPEDCQLLETLPFHYKLYWILYNVSAPSAVMVSVVFWAAVFDPEFHPIDIINISSHLLNTVLTILDFLLVGHPYRLLHFHWTFAYICFYALFTVIYYLAGGTDVRDEPYIYKILDWRMPEKTLLTCVGVLVFVFIVHTLFWGLHRFKKFCRGLCYAAKVSKHSGVENMGMDHKPNVANIV